MNEGYFPQKELWQGRFDGDGDLHKRWHQVISYIDLDNENSKKSGVCIIGFKSDLGVEKNKGRKGAFHAPDTIRKQLSSLAWHFGDFGLYDAGDVVCISNLEDSQKLLSEKIEKIFNLGMFPVVLGGGHEVALGSIMGSLAYNKRVPSVINFDAHFDIRDYSEGLSSGTSFSKAYDTAKSRSMDFNYICLGIQKASNTAYLFDKASKMNSKWITYDDMLFNRQHSIKIVEGFIKTSDNIHLTICSDVFNSSTAPGVSAPQPFGMDVVLFLEFFNLIIKSGKLKSFDIAEVAPNLDIDDRTSRLAAQIVFRLTEGLFNLKNQNL